MSVNIISREDPTPPRSSGHIRALDGLRGFAVFIVFVYHAFWGVSLRSPLLDSVLKRFANSGWIGVDLFFVLSGFLITTILLDARLAENYYKVFYIRRGLRIFPLYYLVVGGSMLIKPEHYSWKIQIYYWLNLSNLPTAFRPTMIIYLAHLWSVAIEEQFYMVWPAIVRLLRARALAYVCMGVIVGLFILRNLPLILRWNARWPELIYRLTLFRVDTLCAGALLALIVKYRPQLIEGHRTLLRGAFVVSLCAFLASGELYTDLGVIRFGYTALVICFSSLIALAMFPDGYTSRIFSNSFLRLLGKYSFAFYLIHPFIVNYCAQYGDLIQRGFHRIGVHPMWGAKLAFVLLPFEFAVIFSLSALSWNFFEGPILKFKRHFRYSPQPDHYLA